MRDRSNSREKAETVRKRGFGLSRPVFCIALSLTLVIGCIPHDDPITSAKAEALVPVAVGAGAATAAALGISETELVLGIMAALGAGIGMQISFNDMYASIDQATGEVALDDYQTRYVRWREKGLDVPDWGDLSPQEQSDYGGWAWHYDEGVWLSYWMKLVDMGLADLPGGDNWGQDPKNNRNFNILKILGSSNAKVAMGTLGFIAAGVNLSMLFGKGSDQIGLNAIDTGTVNGIPFYTMNFSTPAYQYVDGNGVTRTGTKVDSDDWVSGYRTIVWQGQTKLMDQFGFYVPRNDSVVLPTLDVVQQGDRYKIPSISAITNASVSKTQTYDNLSGSWLLNSSTGISYSNETKLIGDYITYDQVGEIYTYQQTFLNASYKGGFNVVTTSSGTGTMSGGAVEGLPQLRNVDYGQYGDYPVDPAIALYQGDVNNFNNYWNTYPSPEGQQSVIVNPFYQGNMDPQWSDFVTAVPQDHVTVIPDTVPDTDPIPNPEPEPEPEPDPDYGDRLNRIANLAFEQAFPFCLINDIRLLSQKVVVAGSAEPDFAVTIPLSDFGIDGVESIRLDANQPETGGGLIPLGDYTRPIITILFIAVLLGFSIKLFLR